MDGNNPKIGQIFLRLIYLLIKRKYNKKNIDNNNKIIPGIINLLFFSFLKDDIVIFIEIIIKSNIKKKYNFKEGKIILINMLVPIINI